MRLVIPVSLALLLGGLPACGPTTDPKPRHPSRVRPSGPPPRPRIRVGGILRLARAGLVEPHRGPRGQRGVLARVPLARNVRSWQRAIDTQGNQFRVAPGGRIVTDGEPHPERQPASVANVAYYFAQSLALMAARYRRQGLLMAAEILDLPARDPSVQRAQRFVCRLLGRLGIRGKVRDKLYRNLVGIGHLEDTRVRVTNHIHRFDIAVPLAWRLLAGSLPKLGAQATVLVLAVPSSASGGGARANLLWTTTRARGVTSLAASAAKRWLTTRNSKRRAVSRLAPPGVSGALTFAIGPVTYQKRSLHSVQTVFLERGRLHHLTLLVPRARDGVALARTLADVLRSFRRVSRKHPCDS